MSILKLKTERDLAYGDFFSLEKLKVEVNEILDEITSRQSKPDNVADTIKELIEKREKPFNTRDIYKYFGFSTRTEKKNVCMILCRCEKAGMIERIKGLSKGVYRKINQEED